MNRIVTQNATFTTARQAEPTCRNHWGLSGSGYRRFRTLLLQVALHIRWARPDDAQALSRGLNQKVSVERRRYQRGIGVPVRNEVALEGRPLLAFFEWPTPRRADQGSALAERSRKPPRVSLLSSSARGEVVVPAEAESTRLRLVSEREPRSHPRERPRRKRVHGHFALTQNLRLTRKCIACRFHRRVPSGVNYVTSYFACSLSCGDWFVGGRVQQLGRSWWQRGRSWRRDATTRN